jgi:hypothetical protein
LNKIGRRELRERGSNAKANHTMRDRESDGKTELTLQHKSKSAGSPFTS